MPAIVTIPISFVEVVFDYERPDIVPWVDRARIAQVLVDSLRKWNCRIDDIEPVSSGKLSEQGLIIKLPLKQASFFFGPAFCRFSRDAVDWTAAEETLAIMHSAISAFLNLTGMVACKRRTAIGLHIQPRNLSFVEVLKPFLAPPILALDESPLQTMAVVAKWGRRRFTLDGSGTLANGIFLKFERDFEDPTVSDEDLLPQLRKDEEELFTMLGIEEEK